MSRKALEVGEYMAGNTPGMGVSRETARPQSSVDAQALRRMMEFLWQ
jgi:hypothetical protein